MARATCAAVPAPERAVLRLALPRWQSVAAAPASTIPAAPTYAHHATERTRLYALVQAYYPEFIARLGA